MNEIIKKLNEIYAPVIKRAQSISEALAACGIAHKTGFYNGHYVRDGEEFIEELFPSP